MTLPKCNYLNFLKTKLFLLFLLLNINIVAWAQTEPIYSSFKDALKKPENVYRFHFSLCLDTMALNSKYLPEFINLKELFIVKCTKIEIPDNIYRINSLKRLVLEDNNLHNISEQILKLENLEFLQLGSNKIRKIPDLRNLTKLQKVTLEDNRLNRFNFKYKYLNNLKFLDLSGNTLKCIPKVLCKSDSLEYLILANNKITKISKNIKYLKKIKVLNLKGNNIKQLPAEIYLLENLEILELGYNNLKDISNDIQKMKKLKILNLYGNQIPEQRISEIKNTIPYCEVN